MLVTCENSHLSLLFASRNVLPEGMSVSQLQRFHTDDIKCSSDWIIWSRALIGQHSSYIILITKDRQKTNDHTVTVMIKRGQK